MIDIVETVKAEAEAPQEGKPKTVIAQGEEKKPKAAKKKGKPKRIANKCDHCIGYSDMACITACPTGAIIQIDPRNLFRRDGGYIERADEYFDPKPFEQGYSNAVGSQGVTGMRLMFLLTFLFVVGCTWEYVARSYNRSLSVWKQIVALTEGPGRRGHVDADLRPGDRDGQMDGLHRRGHDGHLPRSTRFASTFRAFDESETLARGSTSTSPLAWRGRPSLCCTPTSTSSSGTGCRSSGGRCFSWS